MSEQFDINDPSVSLFDPITSSPLRRESCVLCNLSEVFQNKPDKWTLYDTNSLTQYLNQCGIANVESAYSSLSTIQMNALIARLDKTHVGDEVNSANGIYAILPNALESMLNMEVRNVDLEVIGTISQYLGIDGENSEDGVSYDPPMVVMTGPESVGKSLLFSRFLSRLIFPVAGGRCTLMPILFKMKTGPTKVPCIRVVEVKGRAVHTMKNIRKWAHTVPGTLVKECTEDFVPIEHLHDAIDERMKALCENASDDNPEHKHVNMQFEIEIELQSYSFPNMILVDLPGIVRANARDIKDTTDLSNRFMESNKDRCLLVLVNILGSVVAVKQNPAYALAVGNNMLQNASIVYTKADNNKTFNFLELIRSNEFLPLPFGQSIVAAGVEKTKEELAVISDEELFCDLNNTENAYVERVYSAIEKYRVRKLPDNKLNERESRLEIYDRMMQHVGINNTITNIRSAFEAYLSIVYFARVAHKLRANCMKFELAVDALGYPFEEFGDLEEKCANDRQKLVDVGMGDIGVAVRGLPQPDVSALAIARMNEILSSFPLTETIFTMLHTSLFRPFGEMEKFVCTTFVETEGNLYTPERYAECLAAIKNMKECILQHVCDGLAVVSGEDGNEGTKLSHRVVEKVRAAVVADLSPFKLSRFTTLVDEYTTNLEKTMMVEVDSIVIDVFKDFVDFVKSNLDDIVGSRYSAEEDTYCVVYKYSNPHSSNLTGILASRLFSKFPTLDTKFLLSIIPKDGIYVENAESIARRKGLFEEMSKRHIVIRNLIIGRNEMRAAPSTLERPVETVIRDLKAHPDVKDALGALIERQVVDMIVFDDNNITDLVDGCKAMATTKGPHQCIINTDRMEEIYNVLPQLIRRQFNMKELTLAGKMSDDMLKEIADLMSQNISTRVLSLPTAQYSKEFYKSLKNLFEDNTITTIKLPAKNFTDSEKKKLLKFKRIPFDFEARSTGASEPRVIFE
eukprot:m.128773 g.128773  ORF g.128773 m.128773 type:complete len:968 (-) comp13037_c0_seq5:1791-4694(-)